MAITSYSIPVHLRGYRVSLTTASTNYGLANLLAAIDPAVPALTRELVIQSNLANSTAVVFVGDSAISTTRYGCQLNTGDSRTYLFTDGVDIRDVWLRTDTNGALVNIEMADF